MLSRTIGTAPSSAGATSLALALCTTSAHSRRSCGRSSRVWERVSDPHTLLGSWAGVDGWGCNSQQLLAIRHTMPLACAQN
jgi:hypothetical protein